MRAIIDHVRVEIWPSKECRLIAAGDREPLVGGLLLYGSDQGVR